MTNKLTLVKADARIQRCAINDPFSRYKPESERSFRGFKIKETEILKRVKNRFKRFRFSKCLWVENYVDVFNSIKSIKCTSFHITAFSIALSELQCEEAFSQKAGLFLSALINNSKEKNFIIITKHFGEAIDHIGFRNTKNITIQVNAGSNVGFEMERGSITVNGNAMSEVGREMNGGSIIVNGNIDGLVGWGMKNGTVTVKGNAGIPVGYKMNGGTIFLEGSYKLLAEEIRGGNIFHKGKQIVKDGKRLI